MCVQVYACVCGGRRTSIAAIPQEAPTLFLRQGPSLSWSSPAGLGWLSSKPQGSWCRNAYAWRHAKLFFVVSGDPHVNPHIYPAVNLLCKPPPKPKIPFEKKWESQPPHSSWIWFLCVCGGGVNVKTNNITVSNASWLSCSVSISQILKHLIVSTVGACQLWSQTDWAHILVLSLPAVKSYLLPFYMASQRWDFCGIQVFVLTAISRGALPTTCHTTLTCSLSFLIRPFRK